MSTRRLLPLALAMLAATSAAQIPLGASGLSWTGSSGTFAGTSCFGFSCTPDPVNATIGETVQVRVVGELQGPYILLLSSTATQCLAYPGILNGLILDPPVTLMFSGSLRQTSGVLSCPPGFDEIVAVFPPSIPAGSVFAIQAVTFGAGFVPSFTGAIEVTVI